MKNQTKIEIAYNSEVCNRLRLADFAAKHNTINRNMKFSGVRTSGIGDNVWKRSIIDGICHGIQEAIKGDLYLYCSWNGYENGYCFTESDDYFSLATFDMGEEIERIHWNKNGDVTYVESIEIESMHMDINTFISKYPSVIEHFKSMISAGLHSSLMEVGYLCSGVNMELGQQLTWAFERKERMEKGLYLNNGDFMPFYIEQSLMKEKVVKVDDFQEPVKYIAGVDVAYSEEDQIMIAAIVILDFSTLEIIEESTYEMKITFPYVPGLFSFRETPPIIKAIKKLKNKPDIIICDGHGIAHPKGVGMATHLGIKLNIPTIGCAKSRLVGIWDESKLDKKRGSTESLIWEGQEVGKALRTQDNIKPLFVSIGHKISLDSAIRLTLYASKFYRLPETTRKADQLVNTLMKNRTTVEFLDKEKKEHNL